MTGTDEAARPPEHLIERARSLFGDRFDLAIGYATLLCTTGIERGLFGPREPQRVWDRHVLPAAALGELVPHGARVADVGSGAGLPGVPLAIARPDLRLVLVEPMLRRAQFLKEVVMELAIDAAVLRARGEQATDVQADVVVARAVAPLSRLLPTTLPVLRTGGTLLAVKGESAEREITEAREQLTHLGMSAVVSRCGTGADETTVVVVEALPERVRFPSVRGGTPRGPRNEGAR